MTSKQCFKCLCEKPLSEFYKQPRMADGHLNKCKDCTKQDIHAHRHGPGREKVLAYERERAKQPHRVEHMLRTTAKWNLEHPDNTIYPDRVAAGLRGESIQNATDWKPLNWRAATPMRPGALDHEKHGSRHSDGSVKPYANTVHGCVGFLKDRTSNARD